MMQLNPIGIAVPFFFALMGIELLVSRRQQKKVYRMNDAIADLSCGMGDQLLGIASKGVLLAIYAGVYEATALFEMPTAAPMTWVFGMIGVDFLYYWYHRFSHRVAFGWATHVVHHQSEEYNLAVALRQPWFAQFWSWSFYLPLAVLGLPPIVYATCFAFNLLYQFWIHTRLIDRLGPLELVLNTPSHHRVHHGTNHAYLDKNYAGILIVWDRLFGTFVEEAEEPLYGILKPVRTWNPAVANTWPFLYQWKFTADFPRFADRLTAWLKPPGWRPDVDSIPLPAFPARGRGYNPDTSSPQHAYVFTNLLLVGSLMAWLLTFEATLPPPTLVLGSLAIAYTALIWSGLFERRPWAVPMELLRLGLLLAAGLFICLRRPEALSNVGLLATGALIPFSLFASFWLLRHQPPPSSGAADSPGH